VTDAPPIIIDEDAAIDGAFFGLHAGRSCYARAHRTAGFSSYARSLLSASRQWCCGCGAGLNGCRMMMRAAWHCGSVAPIRA